MFPAACRRPFATRRRGQRPKIDIAKRSVSEPAHAGRQVREGAPRQTAAGRPVRIQLPPTRGGLPDCNPPFPSPTYWLPRRPRWHPLKPNGGTPIGDSIVRVKQELDRTAKTRLHILVLTDGENNQGYRPCGRRQRHLRAFPKKAARRRISCLRYRSPADSPPYATPAAWSCPPPMRPSSGRPVELSVDRQDTGRTTSDTPITVALS